MAYILAPSTPSTLSIRILDYFQTPDLNNLTSPELILLLIKSSKLSSSTIMLT